LALYAISSCPINSLAAAVVLASTNGSTCDPHHPSPAPSSLPPIRARRGGGGGAGGRGRIHRSAPTALHDGVCPLSRRGHPYRLAYPPAPSIW
jgi:hypothetical protein